MPKKLANRTPASYAAFVGLATFIILTGLMLLKDGSDRQAAELRNVVVAVKDIPAGARISDKMLSVRSVPRDLAGNGTLERKSSLVGMETSSLVLAGEPVTKRRLRLKENRSSGIATMVPEGHRAFAISIDETNPQGRVLRTGNQVDVLVTLNRDIIGIPVTKTILERKDVISLEKIGRDSAYLITMTVSPEEAQKLAFAQANGRISLCVCPAEDDTCRPLRDVTAEQL